MTNPANIPYDEVLKLALSALIGCLVGLEREVRRKPAGFRTLALISVGSTIFTICSYKLGAGSSPDRIAANIITGVGFLGAGVIFKNGFSVFGLTTAATIWVAAALGMLIGIGEYSLSVISLIISLVILSALQVVQHWIDSRFQNRTYLIVTKSVFNLNEFEEKLKSLNLKTLNFKQTRQPGQINFEFDVSGSETKLNRFNDWLMEDERIQSFIW